jgi:hypothetical protein
MDRGTRETSARFEIRAGLTTAFLFGFTQARLDSYEFDSVAVLFGRAAITAQGYLAYRDSNHRSGHRRACDTSHLRRAA